MLIKSKRICLLFIFVMAIFTFSRADESGVPLIGITSDFEADEKDSVGSANTQMSYVNAILESGGLPLLIPPIRGEDAVDTFCSSLDGLLLIGGLDVWPSAYGEKAHTLVDSLPARRFQFEQRLIKKWLSQTDKPLLGICLGCQFTNVICGGTLVQDIPSQVFNALRHQQSGGVFHGVNLIAGTRLQQIFGQDQLVVNSSHHQAVKKVGKDLTIAAQSADGVIEALELPGDRFVLLVQWHPERLEEQHRKMIFGAFIHACQLATEVERLKESAKSKAGK